MDATKAAKSVMALGQVAARAEASYREHIRRAKTHTDKGMAAIHAAAAEREYAYVTNAREAIDRIFDQVR